MALCLRALVLTTESDGTVLGHAVGPETFHGGSAGTVLANIRFAGDSCVLLGHGIVGEKEPESEDWLCEDIKNSIGDDLSVDVDVAGSISDTPDAI